MALIKSISGIRGTIGGKTGENLTPLDAVKFTAAYGTWLQKQAGNKASAKTIKVVVGRDGRISGLMLKNLVNATLVSLGIDVIDLDLSTTPTVEMAVLLLKADGGIILTASHNPKEWNALKLLNDKGEFISNEEGKSILDIAEKEAFKFAGVDKLGKIQPNDNMLADHIAAILKNKMVDKKAIAAANFSIVVDAVNSTGAIAVPALLQALGVENVQVIHAEINGHFAHNPEPLPEHLTALSREVVAKKASLGIAVDPDVDRLCFVCEDGSMFGEEYTLVAIADYVLRNSSDEKLTRLGYEKNTVSNLSSTRALRDVTEKVGGNYQASAVGEVNVVKLMKETKAVIGGEGNGGIIFPELHYGRDAMVGVALFLSHLAKSDKICSMLRVSYPDYYIAKKKIELTPDIDIDDLMAKIKAKYNKQPINDIDGVKIEFDKEWVHLRRSNTEPIIRIYAESQSETTANSLAEKLITDMKQFLKG
jgi:phosphomannomutase